ncbi:hypothetical protein ACX9MO_13380 [Pseudooceanicola sp. 502str34]
MTAKPIELDRSPAAIRRRDDKIADRMSGVSMSAPTAERAAARKRATEVVEAEELAEAQAAAIATEAEAERARISAIVATGTDMGRPRQALRLALLGPVSPAQAGAILGALPLDADPAAATDLPTVGAFGGSAAQAERRRIAGIIGHAAAGGRFRSACAIALEGDAMDIATATALLAGLPKDVAPGNGKSEIEQRAEGLAEFGDDAFGGPMSKSERIAQGWAKAAAAANQMIGAGDAAPVQPQSSGATTMDEDPTFGLTDAARAAALRGART